MSISNIDNQADLSTVASETTPTNRDILRVRAFLVDLQARICDALEAQERNGGGNATFVPDDWERKEGGGGRSCVLTDGTVIEKAGVMFSHIHVHNLPASATARHPNIAGRKAQAMGLSLVVRFFTNGFDENGMIVSAEYKEKVLVLNRSRLYASLTWLRDMGAIDDEDLEKFEYIERCRNTLAHEMLTFASSGIDFDVTETFEEMVGLLRKIEIWWFVNLDMAIDPDAYPEDLDLEQVTPGPVWGLQMLIDVALGSEDEAQKYYNYFVANSDKV